MEGFIYSDIFATKGVEYLLVISVLLLAAMIGAIVVAKKGK